MPIPDDELTAMARDPEIQREILEIELDFWATEEDGLIEAHADTTRTADNPPT